MAEDDVRNVMEQLVFSRHGESMATAHGVENGEPATDGGLTPTGQDQARELGRLISDDPVEVCVTSEFPRTKQTAALALTGRSVPSQTLPTLNDIRYGVLEGRPHTEYRDWARAHSVTTPVPGGGESRIQVARRLCDALETILGLPQQVGLVVTHEMLLADLLAAAQGETPPQVRPKIEFATPYRLDRSAVQNALKLLRQWVDSEEDGFGQSSAAHSGME